MCIVLHCCLHYPFVRLDLLRLGPDGGGLPGDGRLWRGDDELGAFAASAAAAAVLPGDEAGGGAGGGHVVVAAVPAAAAAAAGPRGMEAFGKEGGHPPLEGQHLENGELWI